MKNMNLKPLISIISNIFNLINPGEFEVISCMLELEKVQITIHY